MKSVMDCKSLLSRFLVFIVGTAPIQLMAMDEVVVWGSQITADIDTYCSVYIPPSNSGYSSIINRQDYRLGSFADFQQCSEESQLAYDICSSNVLTQHYNYLQKCNVVGIVPAIRIEFKGNSLEWGGGSVENCMAVGEAWRDASIATCRANKSARNQRCRERYYSEGSR